MSRGEPAVGTAWFASVHREPRRSFCAERNLMEMSGTAASRVWLITGASRGLGRAFTEAALAAGDRVVGAARDVSPLDSLVARHPGRLLALRLDVTDRAAVVEAVAKAVRHFDRLDIVVNNAGALF